MSKFKLLCNLCSSAVDGIAYRTRCAHLFCPTCAKATFQRSTSCAICNLQQREIDVHEIKNTDWDPIRDKLKSLAEETVATTNFVTTQLLLVANFNACEKGRMELELGNQADQLARLNQRIIQDDHSREGIIASYETQLRDTNKALVELEEAYKEKLRKCQAWEKAYNNIRSHLAGTGKAEVALSSREAALLESEAMQRAASTSLYSSDDASLSFAPSRKTLRTDVSTFRNVTTHRLPAHLLPGGALATSFTPTSALQALSPSSGIRNEFPFRRGGDSSAVPYPPYPPPYEHEHQHQQVVSYNPARPQPGDREKGAVGGAQYGQHQAKGVAPVVTRKRSFFDNEV